MAGAMLVSGWLIAVAAQEMVPDRDPPVVQVISPRAGGFGVRRTSPVGVHLQDASGIAPESVALRINDGPPIRLDDPRLEFADEVLRFTPNSGADLGDCGETVRVSIEAEDTVGNRLDGFAWSFTLELSTMLRPGVVLTGGQQEVAAMGPGVGDGLVVVNIGPDSIIYSYTGDPPPLQVGERVFGWNGVLPYYREITGITEDPVQRRIVCQTVDVSLTDIVNQGTVQVFGPAVISIPDDWRLELAPRTLFEAGDPPFLRVDLERAALEITGGIEVGAEFNGARLTRFHAGLEVNSLADVTLVGTIDVEEEIEPDPISLMEAIPGLKDKLSVRFAGVVGVVPVLIEVSLADLRAGVKGKVEAKATLTSGFTISHRLTAGVDYDASRAGQEWTREFTPTVPVFTPKPVEVDLQGEAALQVFLQPEFRCTFYKLLSVVTHVTPYMEAGGRAHAHGQVQANGDITGASGFAAGYVDWGVTADVGVDSLFGDFGLEPLEILSLRKHGWGKHPLDVYVKRLDPDIVYQGDDLPPPAVVYGEPIPAFGVALFGYVPHTDDGIEPERVGEQLDLHAICTATAGSPVVAGGYPVLILGGIDSMYAYDKHPTRLLIQPAEIVLRANDTEMVYREGLTVADILPRLSYTLLSRARPFLAERLTIGYELDPVPVTGVGEHAIRPRVLVPDPSVICRSLLNGTLRLVEEPKGDRPLTPEGGAGPAIVVDALDNIHAAYVAGNAVWLLTVTTDGSVSWAPVFARAGNPAMALDDAGNLHISARSTDLEALYYMKRTPAGQVLARGSLTLPYFDLGSYQFHYPCIAVDPATGNAVVGAITETYNAPAPYDPPPPLFPVASLSELTTYIVTLGIWATQAVPRVKPGTEYINLFWFDSEGREDHRELVHRKFADVPFPGTMDGLAVGASRSGAGMHVVWREREDGGLPRIMHWSSGSEISELEPLSPSGQVCGMPSLHCGGAGMVVAWEEAGVIRCRFFGNAARPAQLFSWEADTAGVDPIAVTEFDDGWILCWSDRYGRLVSARLVPGGEREQTAARTLRAGLFRLGAPALGSNDHRWALVYESQTDQGGLGLFLYQESVFGECFALRPEGALWDVETEASAGTGAAIKVRCLPDELARERENLRSVRGLITDGVTPLILRFRGLQTGRLDFRVVDGEQVEVEPLQRRLFVARSVEDQGRTAWSWGSPEAVEYDSAQVDGDVFLMIAGLDGTGLGWSGDFSVPQELAMRVEARPHDAPAGVEPLGAARFDVGKPPLVLVHGYNASSATTWAPDTFLGELDAHGFLGRHVSVDYGAYPVGDTTSDQPGYFANTLLDLDALRKMLDTELQGFEEDWRRRWAMTRYDVVGHSQGGVLLRALCTDAAGEALQYRFRNPANFLKGRFRRLVTIGSPHNGSRLAYYLLQLKTEINALKARGISGFGSPFILEAMDSFMPNLVQGKFSPFSSAPGHVSWINTHLPTDGAAHFHRIGSVIDHRNFKARLAFGLLGLWKDEKLEKVVPAVPGDQPGAGIVRRSDGVVDYSSQFGSQRDALLVTEVSEEATGDDGKPLAVAHAAASVPVLGALYGTLNSQGNTAWIARRVAWLLDHADEEAFDSFPTIAPVGDQVKASIDAVAREAAEEAAWNRAALEVTLTYTSGSVFVPMVAVYLRVRDARNAGGTAVGLMANDPGGEPAGYEWFVQIFAPEDEDVSGIRWEAMDDEHAEMQFHIPEGVKAQVVAFAAGVAADGTFLASDGVVVYDELTPFVAKLRIEGVPRTAHPGEAWLPGVGVQLQDGRSSRFFVRDPFGVSWSSSEVGVLGILEDGRVAAGSRVGQAELTVQYGELSGRMTVEVVDELPRVSFSVPVRDSRAVSGEVLPIRIQAGDREGAVREVRLRVGNSVAVRWTSAPYECTWTVPGPGDYELQASAYDQRGGETVSEVRRVTVEPAPPRCEFDQVTMDAWYSGELWLGALVEDADPGDTHTVRFEFSLNSTDGTDGQWHSCGPEIVDGPPFGLWWRTEPATSASEAVWLRTWAVDRFGLASPYDVRRIRVDNSTPGVRFDPHPGEEDVALNREISVLFDARPSWPDGTGMSDAEILASVALLDAQATAVPCSARVAEQGAKVVLAPQGLLQPKRQYATRLLHSLRVGLTAVPGASSSFVTTFGAPAGLRVLLRPTAPAAGVMWEPPLEITITDSLGNRVEEVQAQVQLTLAGPDGAVLAEAEAPADSGVARFRHLQVNTAGAIRLLMRCPALSIQGMDEVEVLPGALGSFGLEVPPRISAGAPVSVVATAFDAFGNVKTDYVGVPSISSGDPRAQLKGLPAFLPHHRGARVFADIGQLRSLGTQWLQLYAGEASSTRASMQVLNTAPLQPEPVSPRHMAATGLAARLTASAFADVDDAAHGASQWQVAEDALFENLVWDSGEAEPGTVATIPAGTLAPDTGYYWRVRYRDDPSTDDSLLWSLWSVPAGLRTAQAFPFVDDFTADHGWRPEQAGLWERGAATGNPTGSPLDDTSEGEDRMILATGLESGPPAYLGRVDRMVSPAVDCSGESVVELSFQRWLVIDSSDWSQAAVELSLDGENWEAVWRNGPEGVNDDSWRELRYDISEIAAGHPTVYVGFSFGPQFNALGLPGWHIDDVRLDGGPDQVLARLSGPAGARTLGQVFDVRILVQERVAEVNGILGGSFDVTYDPTGLQLVSPARADSVVNPPFNELQTAGAFAAGHITGLGGVTVTEGVGDATEAVFATLQFRAIQTGTFAVSLEAAGAGCALPSPIGRVSPARVQCGSPLAVQVNPTPAVPWVEFLLQGPSEAVVTGDEFELQVAVRENVAAAPGFLGGAIDLFFDESLVEPLTPLDLAAIIDPAFQSLGILSGAVAESRLDELGGVTLTEGLADGTFLTYLRVPFRATRPGRPVFEIGPSQAGLVLANPVGPVADQDVSWGALLELEIVDWPVAEIPTLIPEWVKEPRLDLVVGGVDIVEYRYSLDGAGWSAVRPVAEVLSLIGLADGAHTVRVLGRNARGVWQDAAAATAASWRVDTSPPSTPGLVSSDPPAGQWSRIQECSLVWQTASDGQSGLAGYRVAWTGSASPPALTGDPMPSLPALYAFPASGEFWCHVAASDRAGNASSVVSVGPFRHDRLAPDLTLPGLVQASGEVWIPLQVTEAHSGVASVEWLPIGAAAQSVQLTEAGVSGARVRSDSNGSFPIRVTVEDRAGNSASQSTELLFNRRPPSVLEFVLNGGKPTTQDTLVPGRLSLDTGDAQRLDYRLVVAGLESSWAPLVGSGSPRTIPVDLGKIDGWKEACVQLRDADYPSSAYTSSALCTSIWLDRRAWSFAIGLENCVNSEVRFGESQLATDGFDEALDVAASVADPWDNQARFFQIDGGANVYVDYRHTREEQEWLLVVAGGASSINLAWNVDEIPAWVELELAPARRDDGLWVANGTWTSFGDVSHLTADAGLHFFLMHKTTARPPVIRRNPEDLLVAVGQEAVFSVDCEGSPPLQYRWYHDGVELGDSPRVSGAEAPTLQLQKVTPMDAGTYSVSVRNRAGLVHSTGARLLVGQPSFNPPSLRNGMLELSWTGGGAWQLQMTESIEDPSWRTIPTDAGADKIVVGLTGQKAFFRLVFP